MSLTNDEIKQMTVDLFLQQSERDKQYKVGASNISNPCTKHLAQDLLTQAGPEEKQKYWMGAKIGTAIHSFLESAIDSSSDDLLSNAIVEKKIKLGSLDGYGDIHSKPDLVLPSSRHLIDWKTSTRAKVKKLQNLTDGLKDDPASAFTLKKYIGQTQLYAWGMTQAGIPIEKATLVFINRDGTYENDIWTYTLDYNEDIALALWKRLANLWDELQNGAHPDSYLPTEHCYKCAVGI